MIRIVLFTLLLAAAFLPAILAAPKAAPLPVGPDGRAIYRLAELIDLDDLGYADLMDLGFILEVTSDGRVIAWLSPEGMGKLDALEIPWREIPDPALAALERQEQQTEALDYHNHSELTAALEQIAADHPSITRLISAGNSAQGRELWWLKISDNPDTEEDEPGFKYISTMHGDEPVGTETCLQLIHWLTDNYGTDSRVNRLVDEVEIWIMPMMNPDGNALSQRTNANGTDLNRDFPDWWDDPNNTPAGRAVETAHVMNWQAANSTSLSANYHTGALVVNYPFDNNASGSSVDSPTPDDVIVRDISLEYSEDNLPMYNGSWSQGITNGADWYVISGGMQDWNYKWEGNIDVTVELSNNKWPSASQLEGLWQDNQESMISYMERVLTGVRGVITDGATGAPIAATLSIAGRDVSFKTDPDVGNYQRCLEAGSFDLQVEASGYQSRTLPFTITDSKADAVRVDLTLDALPTSLRYANHRLADDGNSDGWLEAGESGHVAVTLENLGEIATGVSGTLVELSAHSLSTAGATWPDLNPGESKETTAPHFAVSAAADTPAGHQISYAVDWNTAEGLSGRTDAFFIPVGQPQTLQQPAADLPRNIFDNTTTESVLEVTSDSRIQEINVQVQLTHTYLGDLRITLIAPDNTQVRLHDRSGGSTNDLNTWYDTQTQPTDDLAVLNDKPALGNWTLRVEDLASGDEGSLDSWTLEVISQPWEDPIAEVLLRGVALTGTGNLRLDWWPVASADSYHVYRSTDPTQKSAFIDVSSEDNDTTDTHFEDTTSAPFHAFIITGEGHTGEGIWGHFP